MSPSVSVFDLHRQGPGFVTLLVLNCDTRVLDFKFELTDSWSCFYLDQKMTSGSSSIIHFASLNLLLHFETEFK